MSENLNRALMTDLDFKAVFSRLSASEPADDVRTIWHGFARVRALIRAKEKRAMANEELGIRNKEPMEQREQKSLLILPSRDRGRTKFN